MNMYYTAFSVLGGTEHQSEAEHKHTDTQDVVNSALEECMINKQGGGKCERRRGCVGAR